MMSQGWAELNPRRPHPLKRGRKNGETVWETKSKALVHVTGVWHSFSLLVCNWSHHTPVDISLWPPSLCVIKSVVYYVKVDLTFVNIASQQVTSSLVIIIHHAGVIKLIPTRKENTVMPPSMSTWVWWSNAHKKLYVTPCMLISAINYCTPHS